jgi:prolyl-tRNA synthetase
MRLSQYFLTTLKDSPADASIISHKLMLQAGMIRQIASGLYNWLPFGKAILKKVEDIIREEMNKYGAIEMLVPCIQPASLWQKSGRLGVDNDLNAEMLKMRDRANQDMIFTPTAEEAVVQLIGSCLQSYKSLPLNIYQINWKFRDEIRPRYGIMRSREFLMKDSYSFHMTKEDALLTYEKMLQCYLSIYKRLGLTAIPVAANTGDIGGDYSHEFHILADTGESTIFYDATLEEKIKTEVMTLKSLENFYAMEEERHDPSKSCQSNIMSRKGIEVGHIFYLDDKYTKAMDMKVQDKDGMLKHPKMGCYGIGVSRIVGAIIEAYHDDKGVILPENISPFKVIILNLQTDNDLCNKHADEICAFIAQIGMEYLYDDTEDSIKTKFTRADLIGIPYQIVIGVNNSKKDQMEFKKRQGQESMVYSINEIKNRLSSI